MFTSTTARPFTLTGLEFMPAFGCTGEKFIGRISFTLNGHTSFSRLPVYRDDGDGVRIDFPSTGTMTFPGHVCRRIEDQVAPLILSSDEPSAPRAAR